jgi:hypothetical protein
MRISCDGIVYHEHFEFDGYYATLYMLSTMNEDLRKMGLDLIESSRLTEEFSAQRGLINELFPYVYEASKRMSGRAISRWLESSGVKLGPVTIAKALRNPKPYWQELADEIEPAARIFSDAYDISMKDALMNEEAFSHCRTQPPLCDCATRDGVMDSMKEIEDAGTKLVNQWYKLSRATREACLGCADFDLEDSDARDVKPRRKRNEKRS